MLVRSAIFNKARKSFGNTTAVSYVDNQTIIKSKISNPKNPNTEAQQLRRGIFGGVQQFCSAALPHIQQYFAPTAINRSPYSSAMRASLLSYVGADVYNPNSFNIEPAKALSNGKLQPVTLYPSSSTVTVLSNDVDTQVITFAMDWEPGFWWPLANPTDTVNLVVIQPTANYYRVSSNSPARSAGTGNFDLQVIKGHRLYLGVLVLDFNGNVSSQEAFLMRDDADVWNPALTVI